MFMLRDFYVDKINNAINTKPSSQRGVDVVIYDDVLAKELCVLYTKDGEIMTLEFSCDNYHVLCWGKNQFQHTLWVLLH